MVPAAEPILASSIWLSQRDPSTDEGQEPPHERRRVGTSNHALDRVLDGGLEYGRVHGITSAPDHGSKEVVQALITTHLCSQANGTAVVIDSTVTLDLPKLYHTILSSLQGHQDAAPEAMKKLDRLHVMKIFDFIGLTEAVAEVRDALTGGQIKQATSAAAAENLRATIPDSEDEEEEMLRSPPIVKTSPAQTYEATKPDPRSMTDSSLLVIDNLSQVVMPLLKNDYTHGQALLTSFLRSLSHLTATHNLCTVLICDARKSVAARGEETLSLFQSCTLRPALGTGFGYLLDVHILLHTLPREMPESGNNARSSGHAERVNVMEVVQDRYSGRHGRWALFELDMQGRITDAT